MVGLSASQRQPENRISPFQAASCNPVIKQTPNPFAQVFSGCLIIPDKAA
ncbi:hypothetical protein [Kingella oralis]|nr:hypothetical protein [Kingella oralis]